MKRPWSDEKRAKYQRYFRQKLHHWTLFCGVNHFCFAPPGSLPWRDPNSDGSVFIAALCAELHLIQTGSNLELTRMLTRVVRRVAFELESRAPDEFRASESRVPLVVNMLRKELYLRVPEGQSLEAPPATGGGEDEVDTERDGYTV